MIHSIALFNRNIAHLREVLIESTKTKILNMITFFSDFNMDCQSKNCKLYKEFKTRLR